MSVAQPACVRAGIPSIVSTAYVHFTLGYITMDLVNTLPSVPTRKLTGKANVTRSGECKNLSESRPGFSSPTARGKKMCLVSCCTRNKGHNCNDRVAEVVIGELATRGVRIR